MRFFDISPSLNKCSKIFGKPIVLMKRVTRVFRTNWWNHCVAVLDWINVCQSMFSAFFLGHCFPSWCVRRTWNKWLNMQNANEFTIYSIGHLLAFSISRFAFDRSGWVNVGIGHVHLNQIYHSPFALMYIFYRKLFCVIYWTHTLTA